MLVFNAFLYVKFPIWFIMGDALAADIQGNPNVSKIHEMGDVFPIILYPSFLT